ncbi:MAG TPA: RNA polymerase-binding protein DksA [Hyphomicrobium sp.]|nr:RNA polymerase-binding protein DksA [Hyphomicrobium sp.]
MSKAIGTRAATSKAATKKSAAKSGGPKKNGTKSAASHAGESKVTKTKTSSATKFKVAKPATKSTPTKAATGKIAAAVSKTPPQKAIPAKAPARTLAVAKPTASKKSEGTNKKMAARVKIADIVLPPDYKPSENEPFMNDMHKAYFRKRLLDWKDEIQRQTRETLAILHEDSAQHADLADRATSETDRATELRTRDRQRKLIAKIDAALGRIEDGSYGYCEDTGEPIGLKRLDARPIATLSVEAQERHERRERVYREE